MTNLHLAPWDQKGIFHQEQLIESPHCDAFDHVNNAIYVMWQDQIAWAHSAALGWPISKIIELGVGWVVQENHCTYSAPVKLNETLLLGTWLISNDQKMRCVRGFQFIRTKDQKTVFRGKITYVTFDLVRQKVKRMPESLRSAFQPT